MWIACDIIFHVSSYVVEQLGPCRRHQQAIVCFEVVVVVLLQLPATLSRASLHNFVFLVKIVFDFPYLPLFDLVFYPGVLVALKGK